MFSKNRKFSRFLMFTMISVMVAFIAEYTFNIDIDHLNNTVNSEQELKELSLDGAKFINCHSDGSMICSDNDDPQIIFENVETYIDSVLIETSDMNYSLMPIQIFYTGEAENYDGYHCVTSNVRRDRNVLFLELHEYVKDLRIDIGNATDSSYRLKSVIINPNPGEYLSSALSNMSKIRMFLFFLISFVGLLALDDFEGFTRNLHKYRWIIGAIVIVVVTLLRIHGSSFGRIAELMQGIDTGVLIGRNRAVRSDEYVAFTEMAISQVRSGFGWFSDIWGYSPSDMFVIYGQPVRDLVTIFRPFLVGYLFLGIEMGLSFYWISRIVIGLLVSYEFGRMLTKDDRGLSIAYAVLVIFSPMVQWWFSTNEFVEMLIAGQTALLIVYRYIHTEGILKKLLLSLGFAYCGGVYVLSLYPAWMIPLIYVLFACFAAVLYENRKKVKIHISDGFIWVGALVVFVICFAYIYSRSGDTIKAILNTAYPGKRTYDGGPLLNIPELLRGWTGYIWSFIDADNACEEVCFISFFPIGIVLSFIAVIKKKIRDPWLICLGIANLLLISYAVIPMPKIIGMLTLLNKSHNTRIVVVIGFLNLIILFRALYVLKGQGFENHRILFVAISTLSCILAFVVLEERQSASLNVIMLVAALIPGYLFADIHKTAAKRAFITYCLLITLVGGVMVNPISRGISSVIDLPQIQEIDKINKVDAGTWMVVGSNMFANIPTVVGADTASALDTYPDEAFWITIGLEDEKENWNRYAHKFVLVGDETSMVLDNSDLVTLYLTIDDLRKLDVDYLFSIVDLNEYEDLELIYSYSWFYIYKVN